jgi:hypothetical protein
VSPDRLLIHANAIKAIVEGGTTTKTPPRKVFRDTTAGRRAWLAKAEQSLRQHDI